MGVNSLPKTVTRQRRGCDLNPGPSAPKSSTLTNKPFGYTELPWLATERYCITAHKARSTACFTL